MDEENKPETPAEEPQQPESTEVTTDSPDEQVPEEVAGDVISPGDEPKKKDFTAPKKKKNVKKLLLWVLAIILVLGAGAAAYWMFFKDKGTTTTNATTEPTGPAPVAKMTYEPVNVSYAYREKDTDPYVIYYRPAAGGKRVTVSTLGKTDVISYSDAFASYVVYVVDTKIYASTDRGVSFKEIYKGDPGAQITSIKISRDAGKVAFGYVKDGEDKNTVKSMDLDGKNVKDLFTSGNRGAFIVGWNNSKQKMIYREGCYNCDGTPGFPKQMDLKANKSSDVVTTADGKDIAAIDVSDDMSQMIFVKSTVNNNGEGIGGFYAPFEVTSVDISTKKETVITTVGTKDEKNDNGTLKTRQFVAGFLAGDTTPYYSTGNQLYTVKDGKESLTYEAKNDIQFVLHVSDTKVIAASGKDTSDYTLDNYDITTKKITNILSGDNNAVIFGVTTK